MAMVVTHSFPIATSTCCAWCSEAAFWAACCSSAEGISTPCPVAHMSCRCGFGGAQFFGCYFNLFRLMAKCGVLGNLLVKEHTHTFVNAGGDVRALDFRFHLGGRKIGAPFHGLKAFFTTGQLAPIDKARLGAC